VFFVVTVVLQFLVSLFPCFCCLCAGGGGGAGGKFIVYEHLLLNNPVETLHDDFLLGTSQISIDYRSISYNIVISCQGVKVTEFHYRHFSLYHSNKAANSHLRAPVPVASRFRSSWQPQLRRRGESLAVATEERGERTLVGVGWYLYWK